MSSALAGEVAEPVSDETLEDMKARHKVELKDMQYHCRQRMKAAKQIKGKEQAGAIAEATAAKMRAEDEVTYRQNQELSALEESDPDAFEAAEAEAVTAAEEEVVSQSRAAETPPGSSFDGGAGKKNKAAKRREKERAKAKEREDRIAAEKAGAGPSPREVEMAAINARLQQSGADGGGVSQVPHVPLLRVHEVLSDGHCLYRAVGHQLETKGLKPDALGQGFGFADLRKACAAYILGHPDDFVPFLDLDPVGGDFKAYCTRIEESAEWGGHPELMALSHALKLPIRVHAAMDSATTSGGGGPVMLGWDEHGGGGVQEPLELTYHLHFYALGEHYNSTAALN